MKVRFVVVALAALCLALSAPLFAAETVLFDDGPTDGFSNAFFIDGPNNGPFSQNISDGFTATGSGVATSLDFGMWVPTGTTPTTVTWWLGTSVFGSELGTGIAAISDFTFHNDSGFGYDVYNVHIDLVNAGATEMGQNYWLSLGNANDSSGTQFDAWDVNNGPATCTFAVGGVTQGDCGAGGESFTLNGTTVPEPGTLVMLGGGILTAAAGLRRRIGL